MKESYWGYWLVLLGIFVIGVMLLVNNISTTNTNDYYNIKEVTQASMIDAVDFSYYRLYGNIKISEQKFVENFMRRLADNVNIGNTYKVDFYDLYEVPPKVTVRVSTNTTKVNVGDSLANQYDVTNTITAILELGVTGGTTVSPDVDVDVCEVYVYTKLMDLYAGNSVTGKDGNTYTLASLGWSNARLQSAAASGDMSEFRKAVETEYGYILNSNTTFRDWPTVLQKWVELGWLKVNFI